MANMRKKAKAKSGKTTGKAKSRSSGAKDALMVLKEDHGRVKQLLGRLEKTTERAADNRRKLLDQLELELKTHTQIEEEIFYPMYLERAKKSGDRAKYFMAKEEHRALDMALPDLKNADPASEEFAGKAHLIGALVEHHLKEEERELFSRVKKAVPKEELVAIGDELRKRRQELLSMASAERETVTPEEMSAARAESTAARRMEWGDESSLGSDRPIDPDEENEERPI